MHDRDLMMTTPGITEPKLSADPLMTEAEATPGPDDINPYNSEEERQIVDRIKRMRGSRDTTDATKGLFKTTPANVEVTPPNPLAGNDPFVFDDIGQDDVEQLQLPFATGLDPSDFRL